MKLRERDLEIDFTDAIDAIVFDQMKADKPGYHGVGQMHRVDFVVELEKAILFVEVKDPGNPKAQAEGLAKFHGELQDGTLSDTFAAKFNQLGKNNGGLSSVKAVEGFFACKILNIDSEFRVLQQSGLQRGSIPGTDFSGKPRECGVLFQRQLHS